MQTKKQSPALLFLATLLCILSTSCGDNQQPKTTSAHQSQDKGIDSLKARITAYINASNTNTGVAILGLEDRDSISVNGHERYAMMSVCKFPQALLLLHLVDSGQIKRDHKIHFTKQDFLQPTHSTLRADHPQKEFDLTIPEALTYSIGQSDNVTSNSIFKLEGGPAAVELYIHSLGITGIGVATDYWHMRSDSLYKNWITPVACMALLDSFYNGKILSDTNRNMLLTIMANGPSGRNRLPGSLPPNTVVAQKTGTSGRDSAGMTYAFNDVGIVTLPNGKHFAIAVFISQSAKSDDELAKIIADLCKMTWDYYQAKKYPV